MDPTQADSLARRLVTNPHDEEALSNAHQAGAADPRSYALLLEKVGAETHVPAYASHWLSEAANEWSTTLGDAHRAAHLLMQAIDRDPTQRTAADRLAQLYRDKGDVKALVALLERRAKALTPLSNESPDLRSDLAATHQELGRLWGDSLQQPKKAAENFRRAAELGQAKDGAAASNRPQSQPCGRATRRRLAAGRRRSASKPRCCAPREISRGPRRRSAARGSSTTATRRCSRSTARSSWSASRPARTCRRKSAGWAPSFWSDSPKCTTASTGSRTRRARSTSSRATIAPCSSTRTTRARYNAKTTSPRATSATCK